jgi:hypothetical protein
MFFAVFALYFFWYMLDWWGFNDCRGCDDYNDYAINQLEFFP